MTDLNKLLTPIFLNEKEIRKLMELLFFSYRDFTSGPDKSLENIQFGRAHHRIIYFFQYHECHALYLYISDLDMMIHE